MSATIEVVVPEKLRLKEVLEVAREIRDLPQSGIAYINFASMRSPGPFSLLMMSNAISRKRNANPDLKILPKYYMHQGYASHMGFFRACGFDIGKSPGEAIGNGNYLPLTKEGTSEIHAESRESGRPLGELVEAEARSLAEVLCRTDKGELYALMTFSLREIIRNTFEHSRSPGVEYCAQYWADKDKVEIAVIDRGIGLFKSLRSNPTLNISDERHAINMAMLPGISRNVRQDNKVEEFKHLWQNSGFGLFMTQRLCRYGGDFFLASGDSGKYLQNDKSRWFDFGFQGTAVRMVFRPSSIGNVTTALKRFDEEAKKIAKQNNIKIPNASTASMMIKLDFYDL
jgi:hypothetical protein